MNKSLLVIHVVFMGLNCVYIGRKEPLLNLFIAAFALSLLWLASSLLAHAEEAPQNTVRMNMGYYFNSISDMANRTDIQVSLNFWAKELLSEEAKKQNYFMSSTQAVVYDRMEDMQTAFRKGELDLIVAPPLLISKYFKKAELGTGFVGVYEGKKTEKLVLVVRNDKNINNVKDLRNKRLGMIEQDELADIFLDTLVLKELKQPYKNVVQSVKLQKKNTHLILDIFFGRLDAGVVYLSSYDTVSELNPDVKNKVKILNALDIKGRNFSYFRHGYPLDEALTKVALGIKDSARGKLILEMFKTPEIDYCKTEDLDVFDKLYKDYLQLKQRHKK